MDSVSYKLGRLREDVLRANQIGEFTTQLFQRAADVVAACLLDAFFDETHPLSIKLDVLRERVVADEEFWRSEEGKARSDELKRRAEGAAVTTSNGLPQPASVPSQNPNRLFFMPHPGISDAGWRQFWPLQLLLLTGSQSVQHGKALAEKLMLSSQSMANGVQAARASLHWSPQQYASYLEQALSLLVHDVSPFPYRREGRDVHHARGTFRLSQEEEIMLQLLEKNVDKPVFHSTFRTVGVSNPAQRKMRLMAKFHKAGINLPLQTLRMAYMLCSTPT